MSLDLQDEDFVYTVLGRDAIGRFRAVHLEINIKSVEEARDQLRQSLAELVHRPDEEFHQGDEVGTPPDFFTVVVPAERLSATFLTLTGDRGYSPALGILRELMHYFKDPDGNFVEQFQSTAFDARL